VSLKKQLLADSLLDYFYANNAPHTHDIRFRFDH